LATIPPSRLAALPGTPERRVDRPDLRRAATIEKAHGRIESRCIAVRSVLPARLDRDWPGLVRICRIERRRETKTLCSRHVIYAITSLPEERIDAAGLLQLARDHWQIENRLFRVRDGTFAEDACRVRSGAAPQTLAHLRDGALALIRRKRLQPKSARETFAANPRAAIRAVLTS
jgi:hypothetical protein